MLCPIQPKVSYELQESSRTRIIHYFLAGLVPNLDLPASCYKRGLYIYLQMQQFTQLNPELFIADCPQLQEYKCALCFQIRLNMRKCGGPCQKNMCALCLRQYSMKTRCPICKDIFQIQNASMPEIRFLCPSLSQQCAFGKLSKEEFFEHASVCPFEPESQRAQFKYKSNYQCQCSGKLRIYYEESTCCECNYAGSCSRCVKCHKKYCLQCRKPPLRMGFCARGHRFTKETVRQNVTVCDLCELNIYHLSIRTTYTDPQCDFDICGYCINNLPQERSEPFQEQSDEEEDGQSSDQEEEDGSSEEDQEDSDDREEEEEEEEEEEDDSEEENSQIEDSEERQGGEGQEEDWEDMDDDSDQPGEGQQQPSCGEVQNGENELQNDQRNV